MNRVLDKSVFGPQVRVSRRRILESAAKVMELYAGSRVVLELEYFGEVGTGLGPTLEFYTLLAHELQVRNRSHAPRPEELQALAHTLMFRMIRRADYNKYRLEIECKESLLICLPTALSRPQG